jgi:SAM-dependent methyltransferase
MLKIRPGDKILEVGSGNRPRRRSDILCDRFIDDNVQRARQEQIRIDKRPFVVANGEALPFKNKSFDYVIASHILEHVDNPERFVAELMRVANAGYIETPSELGEKLFGWSFHKWTVRLEDDSLVLRPRISDSPFGDYFHRFYEESHLFAEAIDSRFHDFYVCYEWEGTIKLRIESDDTQTVKLNNKRYHSEPQTQIIRTMIATVRGLLHIPLLILRFLRKVK